MCDAFFTFSGNVFKILPFYNKQLCVARLGKGCGSFMGIFYAFITDSGEMTENEGEKGATKVASWIRNKDVVVHGQHLDLQAMQKLL